MERYDGSQIVGRSLNRRRSMLVRMIEDGQKLGTSLRRVRITVSMRRKQIIFAVMAITVLVLTACSSPLSQSSPSLDAKGQFKPRAGAPQKNGTANGVPVCGQPILNSPFNYDGATGAYKSGTAGLPTFGTPGSDFPNDTAGKVLSADSTYYPSYVVTRAVSNFGTPTV